MNRCVCELRPATGGRPILKQKKSAFARQRTSESVILTHTRGLCWYFQIAFSRGEGLLYFLSNAPKAALQLQRWKSGGKRARPPASQQLVRNVTTDVSALTEAFYVFYALYIYVYFEQRDRDRRLSAHVFTSGCFLPASTRRICVQLCGLANTFIQIYRT